MTVLSGLSSCLLSHRVNGQLCFSMLRHPDCVAGVKLFAGDAD